MQITRKNNIDNRNWIVIIVGTDYRIAFSIQFYSSTKDYSSSKSPLSQLTCQDRVNSSSATQKIQPIWIDSSTGSFHNIFPLNPEIFYPIHSLFASAHVYMSSNYFSASPRNGKFFSSACVLFSPASHFLRFFIPHCFSLSPKTKAFSSLSIGVVFDVVRVFRSKLCKISWRFRKWKSFTVRRQKTTRKTLNKNLILQTSIPLVDHKDNT